METGAKAGVAAVGAPKHSAALGAPKEASTQRAPRVFFRYKKYAVDEGMKDNAKKALTAAYDEKDAWEEEEWDAQAALILQPYRTKIVHGGKRDSNMPGGTHPQGSAVAIVPSEAFAQSSAAAIAPGEASAQAKRPLCCRSAGAGAKRKKRSDVGAR